MLDRAGLSWANGGLGLRSAMRDKVSLGRRIVVRGQISADDPMPGVRKGWQRGVAAHVDEEFRTGVLWPRLRPQTGAPPFPTRPMAGVPFSCIPSSTATRFEPQEFRVSLLRRLWCPLPLSASSCRYGRPFDPSGHHRVLGRRRFSLEERRSKCVQRGPVESDNERPCPRFGPTTQSRSRQSLIRGGGRWTPVIPRRSVCDRHHDGVPSAHGRFSAPAMRNHRWGSRGRSPRSERAHLPRTQVRGRARMVVVACEVGGRWSDEALSFLNSLTNAKVRDEPEDFRKVVKAAWLRRWKVLLACTAARAFVLSLLERRCALGCDSVTPSSAEVVRAHRYEA